MFRSSIHLTTQRTHLADTGAGSNGVRIAAGVLIASLLVAGALLVHAAGAHTTHPCPCRYSGGVAPPGTVICLNVNGSRSLARCEMVLNNPSWHILQEPCPIASLIKPALPIDQVPWFSRRLDMPVYPVSTAEACETVDGTLR